MLGVHSTMRYWRMSVSPCRQTFNMSVPVHAQLYVICGLGAGTSKIMQDSIAAEVLGHGDR